MVERTARLKPDAAGLARAAHLLDLGRLVAIPTETVYGLAADAENESAVASIFAAKGRPSDQPVIVHGLPQWIERYAGHWNETAGELAAAFWPGPLTLVVPRATIVPLVVTGGLETVGLRCPSHPVCRQILGMLGRGLAAPSANRYGHVSPTTADHVLDDLDGRIAAVVDGGPSDVGVESTIVAVAPDGGVRLLRRGGIGAPDLAAVLNLDSITDGTQGAVEAPGMVKSHYAPRARVEVITNAELAALMTSGLAPSDLVVAGEEVDHSRSVALGSDAASFASGLYSALRLGDDPEVSRVLIVPPAQGPLSAAIADRLRRASHR